MTSTGPELDPALTAKLLEGVGRCLMIYQRIETLLKMLLPHIVDPAVGADRHVEIHWRSLIDSKETLGALVKRFAGRLGADSSQDFPDYLKELNEQRNHLVHHFFSSPGGQPRSNAELEQSISYLRTLMNFALPFMRLLEDAAMQFAANLAEDEAQYTRDSSGDPSQP